mmetsp:Transcript_102721/g.257543  ORF Transcript_102721/g.257543 Transcript_102721/m.257543 type:complete len:398 (+) Transcript_102721:133-1326(+)
MAAAEPTLTDRYTLGPTLGRGQFGMVRAAEDMTTGQTVAVKLIAQGAMDPQKLEQEISNHSLLKHRNVLNLIEVFETPDLHALVLECAAGGDLFDFIVRSGRVPEDQARPIFLQLVAALSHCHAHGVAHLDLKPENVLLSADGEVKLADFGLSMRFREGEMLTESVGSPNYAAPELFVRGCRYDGRKADVWSCGVVLFVLLTGRLPFDAENLPTLAARIKRGSYSIPGHVSEEAADLLQHMLDVVPGRRLSVEEIAQHAWSLSATLPRTVEVATAANGEGAPPEACPSEPPRAVTTACDVPAAGAAVCSTAAPPPAPHRILTATNGILVAAAAAMLAKKCATLPGELQHGAWVATRTARRRRPRTGAGRRRVLSAMPPRPSTLSQAMRVHSCNAKMS